MDNLDIQIVDSLTVNLNQEEYSTEGQVLNGIDVYIEDEQLLFEAALTQDSINLYTRETPDTIIFDTKEITDAISKLESLILKTSKESTLLAKFAELKLALNTIDFTAIEQAIQDVENITAREDTLIQGVEDIIKAVESIDFTHLESSIAEVKASISKIDFSSVESKVEEVGNKIDKIDTTDLAKEQTLLDKAEEIKQAVENAKPEIDTVELAKEDTLLAESQRIQDEVKNIDFSTVKNKVDEVKQAVDNIDLSPIENKVDDGVNTLSAKIDNIDLSAVESKVQEESVAIQSKIDNSVSKQGEDQEATNTAIFNAVNTLLSRSVKYNKDTGNLTIENVELIIE